MSDDLQGIRHALELIAVMQFIRMEEGWDGIRRVPRRAFAAALYEVIHMGHQADAETRVKENNK